MIKNLIVSLALLLFATAGIMSAAALDGKWKGSMNAPDGNAMEVSFDFKVTDGKLTGTVTNTYGTEQITEGVVTGDDVSFIIMAGGGQFKIVYKGKMAGPDIKFKVTLGDFGDAELTAKRQA